MQNEGTIKEYFFKSDDNNDQIYKNTNQNNIDNYNSSSSELERKNDIECYNKVMDPIQITCLYFIFLS
jgi:hypothetical protein